MLVLDLRTLVCIPFALAEAFLLWTLWNLILQGKRKSPAQSRPVSYTQTPASAVSRVISFPESSSADQAVRNSGRDAAPRPQQSGQSSRPPRTGSIEGAGPWTPAVPQHRP